MPEPVHLDTDIQRAFSRSLTRIATKNEKFDCSATALSNFTHGGEQLDLLDAPRREKLEKLTAAHRQARDRSVLASQFGGSLKREE